MGKFYQCLQSYGPSFMTKFCSALYLENLLTNIFAKLNLRGGVSCMPAALLFYHMQIVGFLMQRLNFRFLFCLENNEILNEDLVLAENSRCPDQTDNV